MNEQELIYKVEEGKNINQERFEYALKYIIFRFILDEKRNIMEINKENVILKTILELKPEFEKRWNFQRRGCSKHC